jgi:hypothetical protein
MNLEIKAQHTMTEFDSYKIKLYSEWRGSQWKL